MSETHSDYYEPVIIAGMHRSGTSVTASILKEAGLFVGDKLLEKQPDNPVGFFEDTGFLSLHQDILVSKGISSEGWHTYPVTEVPNQFTDRIKILIKERLEIQQAWGWKDPRTTLFLDFWQRWFPAAKYVFVYRAPWEVIDSLFIRNDAAFRNNPKLAVEVWIAYNKIILDFFKRSPERCLLLNSAILREDENVFIDKAIDKLEVNLERPQKEMFQARLMHSKIGGTHRISLLKYFFPQAIDIYQELEDLADLSIDAKVNIERTSDQGYQDWVLQDWLISCQAKSDLANQKEQVLHWQQELATTQAHLEQTQQNLEQTQRNFEQAQQNLEQTQQNLEQTRWNFEQTQQNLEQTQRNFEQTQQNLEQTQQNLEQVQLELERSRAECQLYQNHINAMKSSKFWKMRSSWFRIKKMFGFGNSDSHDV